jgi:hypothetical protein
VQDAEKVQKEALEKVKQNETQSKDMIKKLEAQN